MKECLKIQGVPAGVSFSAYAVGTTDFVTVFTAENTPIDQAVTPIVFDANLEAAIYFHGQADIQIGGLGTVEDLAYNGGDPFIFPRQTCIDLDVVTPSWQTLGIYVGPTSPDLVYYDDWERTKQGYWGFIYAAANASLGEGAFGSISVTASTAELFGISDGLGDIQVVSATSEVSALIGSSVGQGLFEGSIVTVSVADLIGSGLLPDGVGALVEVVATVSISELSGEGVSIGTGLLVEVSSTTSVGALTGTSGEALVTWNAADKNSTITLSNGDKTASRTSGTGFASVRANRSANTDIRYVEFVESGDAADGGAGIATSTAVLNNFIGNATTGVSVAFTNGAVYYNGVTVGTALGAFAIGDVLSLAWRASDGSIWVKKNGDINIDVDVAITPKRLGPVFPAGWMYNTAVVSYNNIRGDRAEWTRTPPTSAKGWGE